MEEHASSHDRLVRAARKQKSISDHRSYTIKKDIRGCDKK